MISSEIEKKAMPSSESTAEKGESEKPLQQQQQQAQQQQGLSQSSKDDIGVCVVIILITILAVIVTIIKIVLFDINNYPELFGGASPAAVVNNSTTK